MTLIQAIDEIIRILESDEEIKMLHYDVIPQKITIKAMNWTMLNPKEITVTVRGVELCFCFGNYIVELIVDELPLNVLNIAREKERSKAIERIKTFKKEMML